jgi:hypothetical protein
MPTHSAGSVPNHSLALVARPGSSPFTKYRMPSSASTSPRLSAVCSTFGYWTIALRGSICNCAIARSKVALYVARIKRAPQGIYIKTD